MKDARQIAFEILFKIQRQNAYSNLVLDSYLENNDLDVRDKAYVSTLVYGITEKLYILDYNLKKYLKQPLKKLKPEVLTILRIGAYQILFLDKVPDSAAVNESVKLTKSYRCSFASGLVNAVLRNISRNGLASPDEKSDEYLSIFYSCNKWICDMWINQFGYDTTKDILSFCTGKVPVYIRTNTTKTDRDSLKKLFSELDITCNDVENIENALEITGQGNPAKTDLYKQGLFHVQDISSQICCEISGVKPDQSVLDICAAPGGKTFTMAEMMNNTGKITSCDIYEHRLNLIKNGADRLGFKNIECKVNDASVFNDKFTEFDTVLCDAPCSGFGIIRRKPEIRYKLKEDIDKLPDLQYSIMCNASKYVKIGGKLVYSTCTLNYNENEANCIRFLSENKNYKAVDIDSKYEQYGILKDNTLNILPFKMNTDGFFVSVFERID